MELAGHPGLGPFDRPALMGLFGGKRYPPWARPWVVLGSVFFVAAMSVIAWAASGRAYDEQRFGTVAEWTTGMLTAAAVAAALFTVSVELNRERDRERTEQESEAGLVVVVLQPHYDTSLRATFITLWVNVYGSAPLRHIDMNVRWPAGHAMPGDPADASSGTILDPDDSTVGRFVASHLDPQPGHHKIFRCTADLEGDLPKCEVRWFDRWDNEWSATPGRVARRVPRSVRRPLPNS